MCKARNGGASGEIAKCIPSEMLPVVSRGSAREGDEENCYEQAQMKRLGRGRDTEQIWQRGSGLKKKKEQGCKV